jgi:acyl carrier protein
MPAGLVRPVSPLDIRTMMRTISSWARIETGIDDHTRFQDTEMDSLALLELVAEIQRRTGLEIPDDDIERISTVADLAGYLNEKLA